MPCNKYFANDNKYGCRGGILTKNWRLTNVTATKNTVSNSPIDKNLWIFHLHKKRWLSASWIVFQECWCWLLVPGNTGEHLHHGRVLYNKSLQGKFSFKQLYWNKYIYSRQRRGCCSAPEFRRLNNNNQLTQPSKLAVLKWREGTPVAAVKMIEFSELFLLAQSLERGRGSRGQRHLLSSRHKKRPTGSSRDNQPPGSWLELQTIHRF